MLCPSIFDIPWSLIDIQILLIHPILTMKISVHLLPELTSPEELAGDTVVVIDILRATTTINYALAAGATKVIPCLDVDEARDLACKQLGKVLLGGERGGKKIDGFDCGNSPAEYTTELVSGATIVFTTTNGTKALSLTTGCDRVLIGAFVNLSAIVSAVVDVEHLHLLCAGTNGEITREDVLFAGAVVERLTGLPALKSKGDTTQSMPSEYNDAARLAQAAWESIGDNRYSPGSLAAELRDTQGGRNLIGIGLQDDLPRAGMLDEFVIVPELDRASWAINRASL